MKRHRIKDAQPADLGEAAASQHGTGGELVPWDGGPLTGRPGGGEQAPPPHTPDDADVTAWQTLTVPDRQPKVVRVRRALLVWLVCLLVVAALVIAGLVRYLPARVKTSAASQTSPTTQASSTQPSPSSAQSSPADSASSDGASPGATGGASPGSSAGASATPGATTAANAVVAGGGGAGAPLADLSALTPVTYNNVGSQSTGPEQIGATTYEDSVRFTCDSYSGNTSGNIVYDVAGYKFLNALIGIPSNASNGAGNAMTITFYKDGSATQLSAPVTVSLDHPQSVHLDLQGSSQLEISCSGLDTTSQQATSMDVALGNATIGPS